MFIAVARQRRRLFVALVAGTCFIAPFTATQPAGAAFPGANGKIVFASDRDGDYELYTTTSSGSSPIPLTNNSVVDNQPAYSADGTKIVFRRGTIGIGGEIYSMNADGSGVVQLTNDSLQDREPSWSPDGTKIVWVHEVSDGNGDLYVMNADGSGVTQLTTNTQNEGEPVWSPDGQWIAYARHQGENQGPNRYTYDVFRLTPAGTNGTRLTSCDPTVICASPDWSPNGTQIVYTNWSAHAALWTMNADGSNKNRLTPPDTSNYAYPSWSPDGTKIAYTLAAYDPTPWELFRINADGSNKVRLTNNPADDWNTDWQPV
jgi:Tol biopolymer transport system component